MPDQPRHPLRLRLRRGLRSLSAAALLAPALFAPGAARAQTETAGRAAEWLGRPGPASPHRVVSLAPSLTETVVALGHADRLVGVTRYDDAPEVARLPRIGGFLDPNPEAVLALRPDLVLWLTDGGALGAVRKIADLGLPVRAIPVIGIADAIAAARSVGEALGDAGGGDRLARSLEQAIDAARGRGRQQRKVRVLFLVGRDPLVVAGPGSYPDELLRIAGGVNVVDSGRPWPIFPLERAVALDPELVIDGAMNEPIEAMARLTPIPAVKRGDVHRLQTDDALRPGPRLVRALAELEAALGKRRGR